MFVSREPGPTTSTGRKAVEVVQNVAKFLMKGYKVVKKHFNKGVEKIKKAEITVQKFLNLMAG
jgi:hypothetical protein